MTYCIAVIAWATRIRKLLWFALDARNMATLFRPFTAAVPAKKSIGLLTNDNAKWPPSKSSMHVKEMEAWIGVRNGEHAKMDPCILGISSWSMGWLRCARWRENQSPWLGSYIQGRGALAQRKIWEGAQRKEIQVTQVSIRSLSLDLLWDEWRKSLWLWPPWTSWRESALQMWFL